MRFAVLCFLLLAALSVASPVLAQSHRDAVIQRLASEGFTNFRVRRTWLGFDQIVAEGPAGRREVVINPSTGAVKRDYLYSSTKPGGGSAPIAAVKDTTPPPVSGSPADGDALPAAEPDGASPPAGDPAGPPDRDGPPGQSDKDDPPGQSDKDEPPGRSDKDDPPGKSDDKPGADRSGRDF
ncbi:hypothetical protein KUV73_18235 [Mameliella alba]|nr:hypothetical protein [Mameliella alba]MBY6171093.1 hypothetical protein [Mameliella alba]MBY6176317.1 hypothetical protein [Mameliella alba]